MPGAQRQTVYRKQDPQITVEQVETRLREMEKAFRIRWISLMILGALATMFGPVAFGTLIWIGQFNGRRSAPPLPLVQVIGRTAMVLLPILFLVEWLTRGKFMENTAESLEEMGGWRYMPGVGRGITAAVFFEVCLWGPRMVIAGTKKIAGQAEHAAADRAVAATMVHAFATRDSGINIGELFTLTNGRDDVFGDVLAYLLYFEVIGMSKNADRVWMLSDAQRALKLKMT